MASKKDSQKVPSESIYHIKQTVNVDSKGIEFKFYERDGLKKVVYNGRKNPDGNYFIFEKINDKAQTHENLTQDQFLKKIATIPHLKLVNEQILSKMKKVMRRISLARNKGSSKTKQRSKKKTSKKHTTSAKRNSKRKVSKKMRRSRARNH